MRYEYSTSEELGRRLICPECRNELMPVDVESFNNCPYCGYTFETSGEYEDFLLDNLVRQWMTRYPLCRK